MHILVAFHVEATERRTTILNLFQQHASSWRSLLPTVYALCVQQDLTWWAKQIQSNIDPQQDRFFVFEMQFGTIPRNGWLPSEAWQWLNTHSH